MSCVPPRSIVLTLAIACLSGSVGAQTGTVRIIQTNAAGDNVHLIDPVTNEVVDIIHAPGPGSYREQPARPGVDALLSWTLLAARGLHAAVRGLVPPTDEMRRMFDLDGRVAVVTGGASGIGLATVERLAAAGAAVVIADIQDGTELAARVDGLFVRADLTREQDVANLIDTTLERYERLDIMVNNVGGGTPPAGLDSLEIEALEYDFRLNTVTALLGMRYAAVRMEEGGAIVNTSSIAGLRGVPDLGAYAAAKWALVGLTKTAAIDSPPGAFESTACVLASSTRRWRTRRMWPTSSERRIARRRSAGSPSRTRSPPRSTFCAPETVAILPGRPSPLTVAPLRVSAALCSS